MSWWTDIKNNYEEAKQARGDTAGAVLTPYAVAAVAIFAPEVVAAIGEAIVPAGTSAAATTAAGTAVISGTATAASGGSAEDVAKSAALGGAGGYAGAEAQAASGQGGVVGGAVRGGASGAVVGAATGQDIGKSAAKGAAVGALSAGVNKAGAEAGKAIDEQIASEQGVLPRTEAVDYQPSTLANVGNFATQTVLGKQVSNQAAKYSTAKDTTRPAAQSNQNVSSVAMGSQQSPQAYGASDVAILDTSGQGTSGQPGKKGGEYPWGDPEETTALKQEGQVT